MFSKDKLKYYLEKKGWTNYRLAQETGLSNTTINNITNGVNKKPSADTVQTISTALGIPINFLFEDDNVNKEYEDLLIKLSNLDKKDKEYILSLIDRLTP